MGLIMLSSCRKRTQIQDGPITLEFSTDTLHFDTVFSSVGSVTRYFRVINPYSKSVEIGSINLMGGPSSQFRINVNGDPVTEATDVFIPPKDSIWIFVEVTVDPTAASTPYVIEDSITFTTNGEMQQVNLVAWGQVANFYYSKSIDSDTTWIDDLPHVIYGALQVDSGATLTITEGCRVFVHGGSGIIVDGTLKIKGTKDSMVTFQDDRLESEISDKPGMWDGIYFLRSSTANEVEYCLIKNCNNGLAVGFSKAPYSGGPPDITGIPDLDIKNTIIYNAISSGIVGLASVITVENTLVFNTGGYCFQAVFGGGYAIDHCTFVNYGSLFLDHKTPVIGLANNFVDPNNMVFANNLDTVLITNSILYGNIANDEEVLLSDVGSGVKFGVNFLTNLVRTKRSLGASNLLNMNPEFVATNDSDFRLTSTSPAINAAMPGAIIDLAGNPRDAMPDIGAFEFAP